MKDLCLFDLNGDIGTSACGDTVFAGASELVDHMDYLGIERSLVSAAGARESNPTIGNRRLLRELRATPGTEDRLFPVCTINPATWYERGALEELRSIFGDRTARVLATFPATCRHSLLELEPILSDLARFSPVLLWNTRENPNGVLDYRELVELARRYPEITFICCRKMWGGFGSVVDAMRRCSNISVDTSMVHMRRNIELLVENFGAERLFFGTGHRTHYGAAIASLVHADITDETRHLIACGNLERLLGLPRRQEGAKGGRADKPLWDALRHGGRVSVDVLDAHGHVGATNRGWILPDLDIGTAARDTIRQMDRLGIERIFVSSEDALFGEPVEGNLEASRELAPLADRYSGYVVFNPRFAGTLVPRFDDFFRDKFFVGFKLLPSYWRVPIGDAGYLPAFTYANDHRLVVLSHTWNGPYDTPRLFEDIVDAYPEMPLLLGHSGGGTGGRMEAIDLARRHENVYLEFCGSFTSEYPWPETFAQVGFDRVVFGSDGGGAHDQAWELGRLLSQPIPDRELEPLLAENMKRILSRRR